MHYSLPQITSLPSRKRHFQPEHEDWDWTLTNHKRTKQDHHHHHFAPQHQTIDFSRPLHGKVALITNGHTGVGAAVAVALAQAGVTEFIITHPRDASEPLSPFLTHALHAHGAHILSLSTSRIQLPPDVETASRSIRSWLHSQGHRGEEVHILVSCGASGSASQPVMRRTAGAGAGGAVLAGDYSRVFDVSARGARLVEQAVRRELMPVRSKVVELRDGDAGAVLQEVAMGVVQSCCKMFWMG